MLGSRGIWHDGWKAVASTLRRGMSGSGRTTWQLVPHRETVRATTRARSTLTVEQLKLCRGALARQRIPLNDLQIIAARKDSRPS